MLSEPRRKLIVTQHRFGVVRCKSNGAVTCVCLLVSLSLLLFCPSPLDSQVIICFLLATEQRKARRVSLIFHHFALSLSISKRLKDNAFGLPSPFLTVALSFGVYVLFPTNWLHGK